MNESTYILARGLLTDGATFTGTLGSNVGQKRAFGCGLLSVMRM